MKTIDQFSINDVDVIKLGYSFIGPPLMCVHCFIAEGILIDTAQSLMRNELLDILKTKKIDMVLLTHHHEDHSGNAAAIKQKFNLPVYGHPLTAEKMKKGFKILPYQHIMWGEAATLEVSDFPSVIETKNLKLEPVHTPGHSKDHHVFIEKNRGWLFSGDLFLSEKIKYFRADENFNDTIDSLKKVLTLDFDSLFCGHRPRSSKGKELLRRKLEYMENFKGEARRLHAKGYDTKTIVKTIKHKEVTFVKIITCGNVSLARMVKSAVRDFTP